HGVDVRQCIGGGDAAEIMRLVDDGHEEVGGGDQGLVVVEAVDGSIIGALIADQQVGKVTVRNRALKQSGEHVGGDLAAAAAAVRQAGQTRGFGWGHALAPMRSSRHCACAVSSAAVGS